jgi:hypothetical protein
MSILRQPPHGDNTPIRAIIGAEDYVALSDLTDYLGPDTVRRLRLAAGAEVVHVEQLDDLLGLLAGGWL